MENEQGKSLEALNIAMKMEIDGKQYYLKASQSSKNPLGVKLFQVLAKEEADHLKRFENIFKF